MTSNGIGLKAEIVFEKLLKKTFPELNISWTRRERIPNAPFDFELYDRVHCVALFEVKGFNHGRKWYWTQYKRPAIKRKKARMEKLAYEGKTPIAVTIVVRFEKDMLTSTDYEIRWIEGFPSMEFSKFRPDFEKLFRYIDIQNLFSGGCQ